MLNQKCRSENRFIRSDFCFKAALRSPKKPSQGNQTAGAKKID
jgi:hypothetical protein